MRRIVLAEDLLEPDLGGVDDKRAKPLQGYEE
jgi:hypothetical protein